MPGWPLQETPAVELEIGEHTVRVTNPDKVYFPAREETKLDLVQYYLSVGDGITKALWQRPTHLQRFPEGVGGEEIYQKRIPQYAPDWLDTVQVTFPSGRHADVLCVTHLASVAWAANLGTVTFHPWHARAADVDHPDELRIDLDPQPGTGFAQARTAAVETVRPMLDELGFVGYAKRRATGAFTCTSASSRGGRSPRYLAAAIAFAREVERRVPDLVTTSWWKEERGERVFIDFNQNARDRTIASAYSVRRRPDATVSAPLTWDELPAVEPEDFTIVTMPSRFAALGDVHASIDDVHHSLGAAARVVRARRARSWSGRHALPAELPQDARRAQARAAL